MSEEEPSLSLGLISVPILVSMLSPMSWLWEGGEDRRAHHSRVPAGTKLEGGKEAASILWAYF